MRISNHLRTLYGDPVAWDRSGQIASLLQSKDLWTAAFATAATEVAFHKFEPDIIVLSINLMLLSTGRAIEKCFLHILINRNKLDLYIDEKPGLKPSNLDRWARPAARLQTAYALGMGLLFAGGIYAHQAEGIDIPIYALVVASAFVRLGIGFDRWTQVATGKHQVTDDKGPPEEPRRINLPRLPKPPQPAWG